MGILLSFLLGYLVGAKAGARGLDDVMESARAVTQSEEFGALVRAVRAHSAATLHSLGDLLDEDTEPVGNDSVVARVRRMMEQSRSTAS